MAPNLARVFSSALRPCQREISRVIRGFPEKRISQIPLRGHSRGRAANLDTKFPRHPDLYSPNPLTGLELSRVAGAVERCAHAAPPLHACAQVGPRDCLAAIRYVLRLAPTPLALVVQA